MIFFELESDMSDTNFLLEFMFENTFTIAKLTGFFVDSVDVPIKI